MPIQSVHYVDITFVGKIEEITSVPIDLVLSLGVVDKDKELYRYLTDETQPLDIKKIINRSNVIAKLYFQQENKIEEEDDKGKKTGFYGKSKTANVTELIPNQSSNGFSYKNSYVSFQLGYQKEGQRKAFFSWNSKYKWSPSFVVVTNDRILDKKVYLPQEWQPKIKKVKLKTRFIFSSDFRTHFLKEEVVTKPTTTVKGQPVKRKSIGRTLFYLGIGTSVASVGAYFLDSPFPSLNNFQQILPYSLATSGLGISRLYYLNKKEFFGSVGLLLLSIGGLGYWKEWSFLVGENYNLVSLVGLIFFVFGLFPGWVSELLILPLIGLLYLCYTTYTESGIGAIPATYYLGLGLIAFLIYWFNEREKKFHQKEDGD